MKPCASAGGQCPREAVLTVVIYAVGTRSLCLSCHDTYVSMGLEMRQVEPNAYVPEWRQRSLAKVFGQVPS